MKEYISGIFKVYIELIVSSKSFFIDVLRLYSLTLVVPLTSTVCLIIMAILGVLQISFIEGLKIFWVDYYFTGTFFDIPAWRWHLSFIFMIFIFLFTSKDDL